MGIEEFLLQRAEQEGFLAGIKKGERIVIEELETKFVKNLINITDFSNERIASLVDVNLAFVEKIRATSSQN